VTRPRGGMTRGDEPAEEEETRGQSANPHQSHFQGRQMNDRSRQAEAPIEVTAYDWLPKRK
jgi:hypothetical protein